MYEKYTCTPEISQQKIAPSLSPLHLVSEAPPITITF